MHDCDEVGPINCLMLQMKDGDVYKVWLSMVIEDKKTYCVISSSVNGEVNEKEKRIRIDKELGEYMIELGWDK